MKKPLALGALVAAGLAIVFAQNATIVISRSGDKLPRLAVPDFRGTGDAQKYMAVFNRTLWGDLEDSALFDLVPKTLLPLTAPQQPSDFQDAPAAGATPRKRGEPASPANGGGRWLRDWSNPPANTGYLAFGYTAPQGDSLILQGWVYNVQIENIAGAKLLGNRYVGSLDEAGARKVAHEFAADIILLAGGVPLAGTHIYFTSDRTGHKEIWMMDYDGANQRQLTHDNNIAKFPSISSDGTKLAFTSWRLGQPAIFIYSVNPFRDLRYYNQRASVNQAPSFTPDGKQIVYASSAHGQCCQLYVANLDGTGFRPVSTPGFIEAEPKVNPKNGTEIVFSSGRSGPEQVYRMNINGGDVERLTAGNGEASNPSWHPNGQLIAFAWTQGYSTGAFNVFTMDVVTRQYIQLTHGEGKNENPNWSPGGTHLVFASTRSGRSQIYTMSADGNHVKPLTTSGQNATPVWGK